MSDNNHSLLNSLLSVVDPFQVFRHHETVEKKKKKPSRCKFTTSRRPSGVHPSERTIELAPCTNIRKTRMAPSRETMNHQ